MKHDPFRIDLLIRQLRRQLEPQAPRLRPPRDPRERQIRHQVVVFVKPADIAVASGENELFAFTFAVEARQEAHDVEIPPPLVARDRMPREADGVRAIR